jgi:hypothetical protein
MRSFALTYVRTTHPQTDFRRWGTRGRHPFPGSTQNWREQGDLILVLRSVFVRVLWARTADLETQVCARRRWQDAFAGEGQR